MENPDIRWVQRFSNYRKALTRLKSSVELSIERSLTQLEKEGLVKSFEYTQELSWLVMKDYFFYQGITNITGSRDAIREAFNAGLIVDGNNRMDTIRSRNLSSQTYNEEVVQEIADKITHIYIQLFADFELQMAELLPEGY